MEVRKNYCEVVEGNIISKNVETITASHFPGKSNTVVCTTTKDFMLNSFKLIGAIITGHIFIQVLHWELQLSVGQF